MEILATDDGQNIPVKVSIVIIFIPIRLFPRITELCLFLFLSNVKLVHSRGPKCHTRAVA